MARRSASLLTTAPQQFALSGGLISAGDVLGYLEIASGGRALATSIGSGGEEVVDSGGVDSGATVAYLRAKWSAPAVPRSARWSTVSRPFSALPAA